MLCPENYWKNLRVQYGIILFDMCAACTLIFAVLAQHGTAIQWPQTSKPTSSQTSTQPTSATTYTHQPTTKILAQSAKQLDEQARLAKNTKLSAKEVKIESTTTGTGLATPAATTANSKTQTRGMFVTHATPTKPSRYYLFPKKWLKIGHLQNTVLRNGSTSNVPTTRPTATTAATQSLVAQQGSAKAKATTAKQVSTR